MNLPLVDERGHSTPITQEALEKIIAELQSLRAIATDHDARITALEP
jgi:hypothetical protein